MCGGVCRIASVVSCIALRAVLYASYGAVRMLEVVTCPLAVVCRMV